MQGTMLADAEPPRSRLAAAGPYITKGSAGASAQVLSVAGVKLAWATILLRFSPCACGLTNAVIASQLMVEGSAAILLWCQAQGIIGEGDTALIQTIVFALLMIPVFVPILQKVYDGLVVNIVVNCCRKKFNPQAAAGALVVTEARRSTGPTHSRAT